MKIRYIFLLTLHIFLLQAQSVTIAVASNGSYVIKSLKENFIKSHPNTDIKIIIGSTGNLTALIKNGAPYDILMAADMAYPNALYNETLTSTKPRIYVQGSLALLTAKDINISKGIETVTAANIKKIAIANPKTAPYGKAALESLRNAKLIDKIRSKLIYAQTASQTVNYTTHIADIGFIPKSALFSPQMVQYKKGKEWIEVKNTLYKPIDQGVVLLKRAQKNKSALAFYNFLFTKEAKEIFKQYGYIAK